VPSIFEQNEDLLHDTVDEYLGDTIALSTDGGVTFTDILGFILMNGQAVTGFSELDAINFRPRFKVRKTNLLDPKVNWRLRCPKLLGAGNWRMSGETIDEQGRYWVLDIQKASN
jgi:hypothetical protein